MTVRFEPLASYGGSASLRATPPLLVASDTGGAKAILRHAPATVEASGTATPVAGSARIAAPVPRLVASGGLGSGGAARLHRPPPRVAAAGFGVVPELAAALLIGPPRYLVARGTSHAGGTGRLTAPSRRVVAGPGGAVARMRRPAPRLRAAALVPTSWVLLQQQAIAWALGSDEMLEAPHDGLVLGDGFSVSFGARSADTLPLGGGHATLIEALEAAADTLDLATVQRIALDVLTADTLTLGDSAAEWRSQLVGMVDALALVAGPESTRLEAAGAVADALLLDAAWRNVIPVSVAETLGLGDAAAAGLEALAGWLDALSLADEGVASAHIAALVDDSLVLSDGVASTADLVALIADGLDFAVTVDLPDGQYLAWVLHAPSRAFTSYRNYPFNSFACIGGTYYGATDSGLYPLGGDDDAGTPIEAHVRAGLTDFGSGVLKRMPTLYLGYSSTGTLLLKVVVTSPSGSKDEHWYQMTTRPAQAVRENRIKIGRGLKSVYWGFELANVDGADFELDHIEWAPLALERRITT